MDGLNAGGEERNLLLNTVNVILTKGLLVAAKTADDPEMQRSVGRRREGGDIVVTTLRTFCCVCSYRREEDQS